MPTSVQSQTPISRRFQVLPSGDIETGLQRSQDISTLFPQGTVEDRRFIKQLQPEQNSFTQVKPDRVHFQALNNVVGEDDVSQISRYVKVKKRGAGSSCPTQICSLKKRFFFSGSSQIQLEK